MVDNDKESYRVKIEKVILCAGQDGYIPLFKPDNDQYGCLIDTDDLMYRLQVLVSKMKIFNPSCEIFVYFLW